LCPIRNKDNLTARKTVVAAGLNIVFALRWSRLGMFVFIVFAVWLLLAVLVLTESFDGNAKLIKSLPTATPILKIPMGVVEVLQDLLLT
jgi:hypothetical protein